MGNRSPAAAPGRLAADLVGIVAASVAVAAEVVEVIEPVEAVEFVVAEQLIHAGKQQSDMPQAATQ